MASSRAPMQRDAHGKALALNLDASIYGTLAEIGAGQGGWYGPMSIATKSGTAREFQQQKPQPNA